MATNTRQLLHRPTGAKSNNENDESDENGHRHASATIEKLLLIRQHALEMIQKQSMCDGSVSSILFGQIPIRFVKVNRKIPCAVPYTKGVFLISNPLIIKLFFTLLTFCEQISDFLDVFFEIAGICLDALVYGRVGVGDLYASPQLANLPAIPYHFWKYRLNIISVRSNDSSIF